MNIWRRILFITIIGLLLIPTELVLAKSNLSGNAVIPSGKVKLVSPLNNRLTNELKPTLTWNRVADAVDYRVQLSPNKDFSGDLLDTIFVPVLDNIKTAAFTEIDYGTLPWLTPNRRYYWRISGCGSDKAADCGVWSASRFFIPKYGPLDKPTLVTPVVGAGDVTPIKPTFTWTRLPNDELYEIMISSPYNVRRRFVKPDPLDLINASFVPTADLAGLTHFTWQVRAIGKSRWYYGPWSDIGDFTTLVNPNPVSPLNKIALTAPRNNTLTNTTKPELRWKAKEDMFVYQVQISPDPTYVSTDIKQASILAIPNATAYAFLESDYGTLPWLTENRPYYWEVRGCKDNHLTYDDTSTLCTIWSTRHYIPRYRTAQVPVLLSVINNDVAGSLQPPLTWDRLPNDSRYEVWLINNSSVRRFWFTPPVSGDPLVASFTPPTPLKPGTIYHWKVRAAGYKNMYFSKFSVVASFNTPPTP